MCWFWPVAALTLWSFQAAAPPAYVVEGNRVESEFRIYRDELDRFYESLRDVVGREAPALLPDLTEDPPPEPIVYGYGLLPLIGRDPETAPPEDDSPLFRSYSWPLTTQYVEVERERVRQAWDGLRQIGAPVDLGRLEDLVDEYHRLVQNQETIDQHVQYNRFWQRSVAENREKFDRLDGLYDRLRRGDAETESTIRDLLGRPAVPEFVSLRQDSSGTSVVLPIYTDIEDEAYLSRVEEVAEDLWQADGGAYRLDVVFRVVPAAQLYGPEAPPSRGEHIDLNGHVARFASDGAVLTTGAESTHALVGRAVLLGAGAMTGRTIAHEIGHLLGFPDGYVRGYEDLGEQGYEIREVIWNFDDLMTAPASGSISRAHFQLILEQK
jgi:hypothetical protein